MSAAHEQIDENADQVIRSAVVAQKLREAIQRGELAPNQRLIEVDICAQFGVTRGVVRAALLRLATEGLVDRFPNRGARIRATSLQEAIEIIEVRIGPESLVARKAAENITDDGVAELAKMKAELVDAIEAGKLESYVRIRQEIDKRLRDLSEHAAAAQLLERLSVQTSRQQFRLGFRTGRTSSDGQDYLEIVDAVLAGDGEAAGQAMRRYLLAVRDALLELE